MEMISAYEEIVRGFLDDEVSLEVASERISEVFRRTGQGFAFVGEGDEGRRLRQLGEAAAHACILRMVNPDE